MQATKTMSFGERIHWDDRIRPWLTRLVFLAVGLLAGLYIVAPILARGSESYLPSAYLDIPTGIVQLDLADGTSARLPVRIADTSDARLRGFAGIGSGALGNQFLLYGLSRETTSRASYNMKDVRANLDLAVIDGTGTVVAVQEVPVGTERAQVAEKHRWLLAAKAGTFAQYGIETGSVLDPEGIVKVNF